VTAYVAYYGKKRNRLVGHEESFVAALDAGTSGAELAAAVELLRSAQIRALKEKRAQFAPSERSASVLQTIDSDIDWWRNAPEHVIVEGYREPKSRRHMSSAVRKDK
jgi:hypothetical protein